MEIKATMAGTVFQILVAEGETVEKGQTVVLLESMKMEIPIEAEMSGKVKEILVAEGDFVNEGDGLLALEA
jgi:acetyl-CoA carboxylase biotin carboxyl carrier protein